MTKNKTERLTELYSHFESFQCKGLCQAFCSKVHFTPVEWEVLGRTDKRRSLHESEAIMQKRQDHINWGGEIDRRDDCEYLSSFGICQIYSQRPLNCRVYGAIADSRFVCKFGCVPIMTIQRYQEICYEYVDVIAELELFYGSSARASYKLSKVSV